LVPGTTLMWCLERWRLDVSMGDVLEDVSVDSLALVIFGI
jgi:hypothetical protein